MKNLYVLSWGMPMSTLWMLKHHSFCRFVVVQFKYSIHLHPQSCVVSTLAPAIARDDWYFWYFFSFFSDFWIRYLDVACLFRFSPPSRLLPASHYLPTWKKKSSRTVWLFVWLYHSSSSIDIRIEKMKRGKKCYYSRALEEMVRSRWWWCRGKRRKIEDS